MRGFSCTLTGGNDPPGLARVFQIRSSAPPGRRRLEEAEQESPDSDQEGSPVPALLGLLTGSLNENTRFQHVIFIKARKGSL